jgi:DNA modification methylase
MIVECKGNSPTRHFKGMDMSELDLFGEKIEKCQLLREKFIEPPFSILDTCTGSWQNRKRAWARLGIKGECGRDAKTFNMGASHEAAEGMSDVSIFDPALCEIMYKWFCPQGGSILDPFAGGSVRGIVAHKLGFKYSGIDIRQEQVDSNREQASDILDIDNQPQWYCGDSDKVLDGQWSREFDMVFSCPPYADLEVYSDLEGDISNMEYPKFLDAYRSIIKKSAGLLSKDGFAAFVVGEVRDKNGNYIGFVPDTIQAFRDCGMKFYNEAILRNAVGTASVRANGNMKSKKLVKIHQNILVFRK